MDKAGKFRPVTEKIEFTDSLTDLFERIDRNTEVNEEIIIQLKISNAYNAEGFDDEITADDVK